MTGNALRIIVLSHWLTEESGGNAIAAAGYSGGLARLGADVHLVAFEGRNGSWLIDEEAAADLGYRLTRVQGGSFVSRVARVLRVVARLMEERAQPTVLWVNGIWNAQSLSAAIARARWRVPYVIHPAGSLGRVALRRKRLKKAAYFAVVEGHVARGAAAIHCLTEKESAQLPRVLSSKAFVVPLGVEVPAVTRVSCDPTLVGVLARIHPIKNQEMVLDVVEALVRRGRELHVELAGHNDDPAYEQRIRARINRSSILTRRARLLGHVPRAQLPEVVGRWRAALLLSGQESFGHAVLTAAAMGVPTVVSPGVGIGPALDAARAGVIAVPAEVPNALVRLLDSDPDELAITCRRFASGFSWRSCCGELLEHLNSVAHRGVISPRM